MTRDPETPIDDVIDEVARAMTSHATPNLRRRVAMQLDRSAMFVWRRQPLVAAASVAAILTLALWPGSDVPLPSLPHAPLPRTARASTPLTTQITERPTQPTERSRRRIEAGEAWPPLDSHLAPLNIAELNIEPIEPHTDPIAPMTLEPVDVAPLDVPELPRRR